MLVLQLELCREVELAASPLFPPCETVSRLIVFSSLSSQWMPSSYNKFYVQKLEGSILEISAWFQMQPHCFCTAGSLDVPCKGSSTQGFVEGPEAFYFSWSSLENCPHVHIINWSKWKMLQLPSWYHEMSVLKVQLQYILNCKQLLFANSTNCNPLNECASTTDSMSAIASRLLR